MKIGNWNFEYYGCLFLWFPTRYEPPTIKSLPIKSPKKSCIKSPIPTYKKVLGFFFKDPKPNYELWDKSNNDTDLTDEIPLYYFRDHEQKRIVKNHMFANAKPIPPYKLPPSARQVMGREPGVTPENQREFVPKRRP